VVDSSRLTNRTLNKYNLSKVKFKYIVMTYDNTNTHLNIYISINTSTIVISLSGPTGSDKPTLAQVIA